MGLISLYIRKKLRHLSTVIYAVLLTRCHEPKLLWKGGTTWQLTPVRLLETEASDSQLGGRDDATANFRAEQSRGCSRVTGINELPLILGQAPVGGLEGLKFSLALHSPPPFEITSKRCRCWPSLVNFRLFSWMLWPSFLGKLVCAWLLCLLLHTIC